MLYLAFFMLKMELLYIPAVKEGKEGQNAGNATKTNKLNVSYKFCEIPSYIKLRKRSIRIQCQTKLYFLCTQRYNSLKHYMNEI